MNNSISEQKILLKFGKYELALKRDLIKTVSHLLSSRTIKSTSKLILTKYFDRRNSLFLERLLKLRCDERFTHAFTACSCVFKEIMLVGTNQGNYFENATVCSKRTLKTTVATQLKPP